MLRCHCVLFPTCKSSRWSELSLGQHTSRIPSHVSQNNDLSNRLELLPKTLNSTKMIRSQQSCHAPRGDMKHSMEGQQNNLVRSGFLRTQLERSTIGRENAWQLKVRMPNDHRHL
jgi:hypothetical protein